MLLRGIEMEKENESHMKFTKDRKGSVTLFVLVSTLFFLVIVVSIAISYKNKEIAIDKQIESIKDSYEKDVKNEENVYNQKINELPSTEYTKPYFPNSDFKYYDGNLSDGLVIRDKLNNEYIWIEVPRTTTVYPTAGLAVKDFVNMEYTLIENDLHTYTSAYRNGTSYEDLIFIDSVTSEVKRQTGYDKEREVMPTKSMMQIIGAAEEKEAGILVEVF